MRALLLALSRSAGSERCFCCSAAFRVGDRVAASAVLPCPSWILGLSLFFLCYWLGLFFLLCWFGLCFLFRRSLLFLLCRLGLFFRLYWLGLFRWLLGFSLFLLLSWLGLFPLVLLVWLPPAFLVWPWLALLVSRAGLFLLCRLGCFLLFRLGLLLLRWLCCFLVLWLVLPPLRDASSCARAGIAAPRSKNMAVVLMTPSTFISVASITENSRARRFSPGAVCYLSSAIHSSFPCRLLRLLMPQRGFGRKRGIVRKRLVATKLQL